MAGLANFLGQDAGGSLRIEEAVANDLLTDLIGAAVGGLGAAAATLQGQGTPRLEELAQLIVTLFAKAELAGGRHGAGRLAFAFVEHGQFAGNLVIVGHGQGAGGSGEDQLWRIGGELNHEGRVSGLGI